MKPVSKKSISGLSRYRIRTILTIAFFWTAIDVCMLLLSDIVHLRDGYKSILYRAGLVLAMSFVLGYLFIYGLKKLLQNFPLWLNFLLKSIILLLAAFLMNFLVHFVQNLIIMGYSPSQAVNGFIKESLHTTWLIQKTVYWLIVFIVTQLYIEINEKYSPGVFVDILLGRYFRPIEENRIVMFIDLKDSTPIAEKLGHRQYFLFIQGFIKYVSLALIDYGGRIYQYVGDEIVVSWSTNKRNIKNCLAAVIGARKAIQRNSEDFRRDFSEIPEFRVGIHVGDVMVGEIGVIKKDLAMSGDTMNTTARIRSACNELNQKFIVSKDFVEISDLKDWQVESLGLVDLKGKASGIELFSLKI